MKHFVVVADAVSKEVLNLITTHIRDKGHGYWHWISNVWLISTNVELSASQLRDELMALTPYTPTICVFPVTLPKTEGWAVYAPRTWQEWLQTHWPPH